MFWFLQQTDICTLPSAIRLGGIQIFFGSDWDTFMEFSTGSIGRWWNHPLFISPSMSTSTLLSFATTTRLADVTNLLSCLRAYTHIIDSPLGWIRRVNEILEGTPSPELKWKLWNLWTSDKVPDYILSLPYRTFFYIQTVISSLTLFFVFSLHCAGSDGGWEWSFMLFREWYRGAHFFLLARAAEHSTGSFTLGLSENRWIADASSCTVRSVRGRPSVL